jgi:WXXGXW repeat (2 copies)
MRRALISSAVFALLMFGGKPASAQVSFGIEIGRPPAPRAFRVPAQPSPDYEWVEGYWYPVRGRWVWHDGYWSRPPFSGAYWVAPYYWNGRYVGGYWDGARGRYEHDHRWDRDRRRDWREDRRNQQPDYRR